MGYFSIIVPETTDTTNLITNPSIETATTGYTAVGGSVAQSSTEQKRGFYSLAVTPTTGTTDGVYYGTVSLSSGTSYTFSLDFWGVNAIPYKIYFAATDGTLKGTATTTTGIGDWQRLSVTWACDSSTTYRVYVTKNTHASTGVFYIDGLQVIAKAYDLTYIDGDQDGCIWTNIAHAGTSTLLATSRKGGREYDLQTYGFYVSEMSGVGMPSLIHNVQERSLLDGALFLGTRTSQRSFILVGKIPASSYATLHTKRKLIINAIKPDLVKGAQPFILKYVGANSTKPVEIECVYDSGLEFHDLEGFVEKVAIRLIAYNPYWYELGNDGFAITPNINAWDAYYGVTTVNSTWNVMDTGLNNSVYSSAVGADGRLYLGGAFTNAGSIADADRIASWDAVAGYLNLTTGANSSAYSIAPSPDGSIYFGGAFTAAGGVADTAYIAKWSGSAWSALGTGMNATVYALVFGQDGFLYAGGAFTSAGGVANTNYIAKWNGTAWVSLGNSSGSVTAIAVGKDGSIYAGGTFATIGGVSCANIAKWDGTAWSALGSGVNSTVNAIAVMPDGSVIAGGAFTTAGGVSCARIAKWNGSSWSALGSGVNDLVHTLAVNNDGLLYVGGEFTTAGGLTTADRIAVWNGSTWAHLNVNLPGTPIVYTITIKNNNDIFIGFSTNGAAAFSYLHSVVNSGTATAYPKITLKRSGGTSAVVEYIKNETTGATLWCNYGLLDGETLVLDFSPGKRTITSSFFGNVTNRALLRNSDFSTFNLIPGTNKVSVFVNSLTSNVTGNFQWVNTHWSVDGVAV